MIRSEHNLSYTWMVILAALFLFLVWYGRVRAQGPRGGKRGANPTRAPSTTPSRFQIGVTRPVPRFLGLDDPVRIVTRPDLPEFDRGDAGRSDIGVTGGGDREAGDQARFGGGVIGGEP